MIFVQGRGETADDMTVDEGVRLLHFRQQQGVVVGSNEEPLHPVGKPVLL